MTADAAREEGLDFLPRFDRGGLLTCVTLDDGDGSVLMVAHMNAEALDRTLETGIAHYWSRSRQTLWRKGDTSGHAQYVRGAALDCDGDTLLVTVDQVGAACHTGEHACFDVDPLRPTIGSPNDHLVND